ncbi:hypothetical protein NEMBOFW57_009051 [Staphylotrichum longicolle]|uniref:3CxxC-type domain-containing protein n=1 Tax=Staphylotrichum longicolle TaxID=669026 RepID=A0AAD4ESE0_9PEZI|nr:hypothetical protein NEMBOFW57_009051 [Staphylotrichum longicolle]
MPSAKKPYKPKKRRADFGTAMFPNLHKDVENALSEESISPPWSFNHAGGDAEAIQTYGTNIMGRFECRNNECQSGGWGSKKIAIEIRRYRDNGYNALVFKQRCKTCKRLGVMRIDENSYVERVTYRLKKCYIPAISIPHTPFRLLFLQDTHKFLTSTNIIRTPTQKSSVGTSSSIKPGLLPPAVIES